MTDQRDGDAKTKSRSNAKTAKASQNIEGKATRAEELNSAPEHHGMEIDDRGHSVKNTFGENVSCLLKSVTHIDDLVQGADYIGHEPLYCEFTQRACFRILDQDREVVPIDDDRLTTVWSELIKYCCIEVPAGKGTKFVPAKFRFDDLVRIAATLRNETKHRLPHRRINRAADLFDAFCDVGDEDDGEFVANWFLQSWQAEAPTDAEADLVRELSIRMGVNILDRAYRPGGGLKMWPVLVGPSNLGKTLFTRNILPRSMQNAKLHGQALALSKTRDQIVRKIAGELVCELPELADVQVKETERLKDILSMSVEKARVLYNSWEREFNMTCAFVGTANPERPLLPPQDPALTLRLPLIVIGSSPWGSERRVEEQMCDDDEDLKKRLWRGWKYWYRTKGVDPELPLSPEMQKLVMERAAPYTYIDTGTSEALRAVEIILRQQWNSSVMDPDDNTCEAQAARAVMADGVMAVDLVRVLDRTGFKMAGVRNPTVKIGRLLATDDDWLRVGGNSKGYKWTYLPLLRARPTCLHEEGAVLKAAKAHGVDLSGPPAPTTLETHNQPRPMSTLAADDDDTIPF